MFTGPPALYPLGQILERAVGVDIRGVVETTNDERFLSAVVPSANIFATANKACRYLGMSLWRHPEVTASSLKRPCSAPAVCVHRADSVIKLPIQYRLGSCSATPS